MAFEWECGMIWLPWGAQSWEREGKVKMEFTGG